MVAGSAMVSLVPCWQGATKAVVVVLASSSSLAISIIAVVVMTSVA